MKKEDFSKLGYKDIITNSDDPQSSQQWSIPSKKL